MVSIRTTCCDIQELLVSHSVLTWHRWLLLNTQVMFPYWGPTNISRHGAIFSRPGCMRLCIYRLVAGFSKLYPGFDLRLVHVRFVVHTVALGQVSLPVLHLSPVSIIPPILHASLHVHVALTGRTSGRSLGTFKKQRCSGNRGALVRKVFSLLCAVVWRAARCDRYGGTPSATTMSKGPLFSSKVQFTHLCRGTDVNSWSIVYCGRGLNTGPSVEARHCPQLQEISYLTCSESSPRRALVFTVFSCSELFPAV